MEKMQQRNTPPCRHQRGQRAQKRARQIGAKREAERRHHRQRSRKNNPDQQQQTGRCQQRAAQVVRHAPQTQCVYAKVSGVQHQRQQLPVAPGPAMKARRRHAGMVGVLFHQRDVAHIAAARDAAFQQIVTQDAAFGHAVIEGGMHRRNVQQALSGEGPEAKQVLVQIGGPRAVGVQAALPRKHHIERRAFRLRRQGRDHPRLQDAIASRHPAAGAIDLRRVQRVRGNRHQVLQRPCRQAGITVERQHIAYAIGQPHVRTQRHEAGSGTGGQLPD